MGNVGTFLKNVGLNVWAGIQTGVGLLVVYVVAKHFGLV